MAEPNYAGNIIVNLASLPDFLRRPILKKRMVEFFSLSGPEKREIISNALEAGPAIPFSSFSKLFGTWLDVLTTFSEDERQEIFAAYISEVGRSPHRLIRFHLDGILEIYLLMDAEKKDVISRTIRSILDQVPTEHKRRILLVMPDSAREHLGV